MMPAMPTMGYSQVFPPDPEKHREILTKRVAMVKRLTDALFEYLTYDTALTLETIDDEPPVPTFTLEDLNRAQRQRDEVYNQVEMINNAMNAPLKDGTEELIGPFKSVIKAMTLPIYESQLRYIDERISEIQKSLESGDSLTDHSHSPSD